MPLRSFFSRRDAPKVSSRIPTVNPRRTRRLPGHRAASFLSWLGNESLALFALSGAALTVMAELGHAISLARQFSAPLSAWQDVTRVLWRPPIELIGLSLHPDLVAALNVSAFMALLGAGARLSAWLSGAPLAPLRSGRFFDDQTWPSLIIFASLCLIFMLGHDPSKTEALTVWNSKELGKYAFAIIVTAGYFAGDYVGHRAFHVRLYRLAALVAILVGINSGMVLWR